MHLKLIHVSHCCRTWREMPLPASEHVSFPLFLFPSLGRSSTAVTAIVYCQAINNCSLGKRHPLLNWSQHPKHLRVQINSGFPGSKVRNLLCTPSNNRTVRQHWLVHLSASGSAGTSESQLETGPCCLTATTQVPRHSLNLSERNNNE